MSSSRYYQDTQGRSQQLYGSKIIINYYSTKDADDSYYIKHVHPKLASSLIQKNILFYMEARL